MLKKIILLIFFLGINFLNSYDTKTDYELSSSYLFPLIKPVRINGKILCTSWYSKKRTEIRNGKKIIYQYKALNYPAKYGEAVIAPFDGIIETTNISGYEGGSITIRSNDGITTVRFCHLSNFAVLKDTVVRQGQIVGQVGCSGRTTGPHLRVVFERNGERFFVNAETWGMKYSDFHYSNKEFDSTKTEFYKEIK